MTLTLTSFDWSQPSLFVSNQKHDGDFVSLLNPLNIPPKGRLYGPEFSIMIKDESACQIVNKSAGTERN